MIIIIIINALARPGEDMHACILWQYPVVNCMKKEQHANYDHGKFYRVLSHYKLLIIFDFRPDFEFSDSINLMITRWYTAANDTSTVIIVNNNK